MTKLRPDVTRLSLLIALGGQIGCTDSEVVGERHDEIGGNHATSAGATSSTYTAVGTSRGGNTGQGGDFPSGGASAGGTDARTTTGNAGGTDASSTGSASGGVSAGGGIEGGASAMGGSAARSTVSAGGHSIVAGGAASGASGTPVHAGGALDSGSSSTGAGTGTCGTSVCTGAEVCVAYRILAGAMMRPDSAGNCPTGQHLEGSAASGYCLSNYGYACRAPVGCAGSTLSCACGKATCPTPYDTCEEPASYGTWLEYSVSLVCQAYAP